MAKEDEAKALAIQNSELAPFFDLLPVHLKLTAGQAASSEGLIMCLVEYKKQLQADQLNIDVTDPNELAKQYMLLRMRNLLIDDMLGFLAYASQFYLTSTASAEPKG